jgi:hypothetical protein
MYVILTVTVTVKYPDTISGYRNLWRQTYRSKLVEKSLFDRGVANFEPKRKYLNVLALWVCFVCCRHCFFQLAQYQDFVQVFFDFCCAVAAAS